MTSAHIFFIPGMIMIGLFIGFVLGARAARNQADIQQRRDAEREAARAARAAKRAEIDDKKSDDKKSDDKKSDKPEAAEAKSDGAEGQKSGKGKRAG